MAPESMTPYYADESVTLYHGDCREITEWLDADVLVTDPPYGVAYKSGWDNKFRDITIACDETTLARDQVLDLWGTRPALVFGSWKMPRPNVTKLVLIWDKGTVGMGDLTLPWFPCTEEVYVIGSGWVGSRTSAVLRHVGRNQHHPTEKPTPLLHSLIEKCPPGVIADPFAGSGSTLVAARNHGRRAVGVEIDERYCEIAAKRLAQGLPGLRRGVVKHGQGHAERPFHGGQCACDDCMSYDLTVTGYGTSMHYPYCKDRSCTGLPSATDHRPVPVRHDGVVLHPAQRARRPTPKRGLVVTDSTPATAGLPYDRKVLVDVLVYQHRKDIAGCGCGWAELGRSWPEHVATVYEESVRART